MLNLNASDIFDGNYLLLERLGQGGFAEVWKVKNLNADLLTRC